MQIHAAALCKEDSQETVDYFKTNKQKETVQCYSKTYDERQGPTDERSALLLTGPFRSPPGHFLFNRLNMFCIWIQERRHKRGKKMRVNVNAEGKIINSYIFVHTFDIEFKEEGVTAEDWTEWI